MNKREYLDYLSSLFEDGDLLFMYANPKSFFSVKIGVATKGSYSHCLQVVDATKISCDTLVADSRFPKGIGIRSLCEAVGDRLVDVMRLKDTAKLNPYLLHAWWVEHQGVGYDWLYFFGAFLKKPWIQNPFKFVCSEAICVAMKTQGIILKGNSPNQLSKDEHLKFVF